MTRYRVVIAKRAERHIQDIDSWWLANRQDAPDLFLEELNTALGRLSESPRVGIVIPSTRPRGVRRILLRNSGYHVYFTIHGRRAEVRIRAVWYAARGGKPKLG